MVYPGQVIVKKFTTYNGAGETDSPDALPVARVWIQGVDTSAGTVALVSGNDYTVTTTVPAAMAYGNSITIMVKWEVNEFEIPFRALEDFCGTSSTGVGVVEWTYTLTDSASGLPIPGATIWITTDAAGANVIASETTNAYGVITCWLDAGTVYVWGMLGGYSFTNPTAKVVGVVDATGTATTVTVVGRVTSAEVLEIINETIPSTVTDVTAMILVAHAMIDKVIVEDYPDEFDDDYLKEMERWLAAHFTAIRYQTNASEAIETAKETYQFKLGLRLENTMWGQAVLVMDTTGSFAKLNVGTGRKIKMFWLGQNDENGFPN